MCLWFPMLDILCVCLSLLCVFACPVARVCMWVICHHQDRNELADRGQSNLHHSSLIHRKCMHEATKHGQAHDHLQSWVLIISLSALCASTALHETSSGYMQGLKRDIYTEPPGMHFNLSTVSASGSCEYEINPWWNAPSLVSQKCITITATRYYTFVILNGYKWAVLSCSLQYYYPNNH